MVAFVVCNKHHNTAWISRPRHMNLHHQWKLNTVCNRSTRDGTCVHLLPSQGLWLSAHTVGSSHQSDSSSHPYRITARPSQNTNLRAMHHKLCTWSTRHASLGPMLRWIHCHGLNWGIPRMPPLPHLKFTPKTLYFNSLICPITCRMLIIMKTSNKCKHPTHIVVMSGNQW